MSELTKPDGTHELDTPEGFWTGKLFDSVVKIISQNAGNNLKLSRNGFSFIWNSKEVNIKITVK